MAAAVDWQPGDNVVFCPELEHPNNIYCWQVLVERGVELRMVPARGGAIDTGAMAAAIDRRTRVVTTSSVTFTPGFRTDLAALGRACRDAGALFLVDAVQSLGVLDLNVEDAGVDALATSASKGLLGPAGVGFLFVRQAWAERLRPAYVARFSVERGAGHESEMENLDFRRLPNARRFEIGNYNYIGLAAVQASLGELLGIGIARDRSACPGARLRSGRGADGAGTARNRSAGRRRAQPYRDRRATGGRGRLQLPRPAPETPGRSPDGSRGKVFRATRPGAVRIPLLQR